MKRLIVFDGCIRGTDSRTRALAEPLLQRLSERYEIERVELDRLDLRPVSSDKYLERKRGKFDPTVLTLAAKIRDADRIVLIAPFWDMSFPAVVKVFFEQVTINGVLFRDVPGGFEGCCAAEKMLYITTRGWEIADNTPLEQASPYLKALCFLWGIPELITISAYGMDLSSEAERQCRLNQALEKGLSICERF